MSSRRRQREISECLGAIHDVTPGLQGFKAILKKLRFRWVRLRQQARKVVERLAMIRIYCNHLAPTLNGLRAIAAARGSLSQHKERVGVIRIDGHYSCE